MADCMSRAGTLTRRHRIPKPAPDDHLFYRADDLNIGVDLCIYGRVMKLTNCDEFTKQFLKKLGVRVNNPVQIPADPYMSNRKAVSACMTAYILCVLHSARVRACVRVYSSRS